MVQEVPAPPGDWVLADEPGECIVSLTKKFGEESILIEMNINDQVPHKGKAKVASCAFWE